MIDEKIKHNIRYHAETLELEEKVAKSKAKVKEEARMEILT